MRRRDGWRDGTYHLTQIFKVIKKIIIIKNRKINKYVVEINWCCCCCISAGSELRTEAAEEESVHSVIGARGKQAVKGPGLARAPRLWSAAGQ